MPKNLKTSIVLLILSCVSCLIAVYIEGKELGESFFEDPFIAGFNIIWVLVIIWLIYDLIKGKDISVTLILVGFVMLGSILFELYEFGFGNAHYFFISELSLFIITYLLLNTSSSKEWFEKHITKP